MVQKQSHESQRDKCHLLITRDRDVTKLSFENHVSSLCKKASQKLHALARVVNFMDLAERKSLMKAFITSQFNYSPLYWMFHSRQLNNRINEIHERALKHDNKLTLNDPLELDNLVTIHQRNLQILAIEIFKLKSSLVPEIMTEPHYILTSFHYNEIKEPH